MDIAAVLRNLHTIGSISTGDKIRTGKGGPQLIVDRVGPLQGAARWLNGARSHRNSSIQALKTNIDRALEAVEDRRAPEALRSALEKGLRSAARGLVRVQKTYADDEYICRQISDIGGLIREALRSAHHTPRPEDTQLASTTGTRTMTMTTGGAASASSLSAASDLSGETW